MKPFAGCLPSLTERCSESNGHRVGVVAADRPLGDVRVVQVDDRVDKVLAGFLDTFLLNRGKYHLKN